MTNLKTSVGKKLSGSILLLALFWVITIRLPTAIWIGPFSLNAYLTGFVALLAGLLALITLLSLRKLTNGQSSQPKTPVALVVGATSALPFLGYSIVILALDFRLEGFQNALVWAAFSFVMFSLPLWLTNSHLERISRTLRIVVLVVPATKIIGLYGGFDFYGEASYALVAVILLAYAVAQKPQAWFDYLGPWLLLFSILLCDVRTAAVVAAALMVFSLQHLPLRKLWRVLASLVVAAVAFVLVWLFVGDRISDPGDRGLGPIGTTNRAAGWTYLFENLPAGTNWFGQGAGLSSYLIDDLLGIHHPHNEYIRIFFDFGVVGLGLFLLGSLALFVALVVVHRRNKAEITLAAPLMVLAVALTAVTDNPIVFAYVMVPVAVIVSAAFATDKNRVVAVSSTKT
jgi:hypothetical protein